MYEQFFIWQNILNKKWLKLCRGIVFAPDSAGFNH